jgi:ABC-type bacteriocin/lantibiotic exporter with double-glycine peptidase domain
MAGFTRVISDLPSGIHTNLKEQEVRLSGGQIQRIGIARALYPKPKIVFFDQATRALDENAEHLIMESIEQISYDTAIVLIAHRLNTIKRCEKIFHLSHGKIESIGSYEEISSSTSFKKLSGLE